MQSLLGSNSEYYELSENSKFVWLPIYFIWGGWVESHYVV